MGLCKEVLSEPELVRAGKLCAWAGGREPEYFKRVWKHFRPNRVEPRENPLVPVVINTTWDERFFILSRETRRFSE
jgi:hypothetical protein